MIALNDAVIINKCDLHLFQDYIEYFELLAQNDSKQVYRSDETNNAIQDLLDKVDEVIDDIDKVLRPGIKVN